MLAMTGTGMRKSKPARRENAYDHGAADYDRRIGGASTASAIVDDPLEPGKRLEVTVSLRDDILRHLRVRGEIDEAQFQAGRRYERYVELSQIGSVRAMDTTMEPVDGGGMAEAITDRQIDAVRQLSEAGRVLGRRGEALVRRVLVNRDRFKTLTSGGAEREVAFVRRMFFDCLDELAEFWGLANGRKS
jgi:hypothetical protein